MMKTVFLQLVVCKTKKYVDFGLFAVSFGGNFTQAGKSERKSTCFGQKRAARGLTWRNGEGGSAAWRGEVETDVAGTRIWVRRWATARTKLTQSKILFRRFDKPQDLSNAAWYDFRTNFFPRIVNRIFHSVPGNLEHFWIHKARPETENSTQCRFKSLWPSSFLATRDNVAVSGKQGSEAQLRKVFLACTVVLTLMCRWYRLHESIQFSKCIKIF